MPVVPPVARTPVVRAHAPGAARGVDDLTGLADRRTLRAALGDALTRGDVHLVLLDVDRFREVNQALGQDAGDMYLAQLAAAVRARLHPGELAGRLSGDEFAVLSDAEDSDELTTRLRAAAAHPIGVAGQNLTPSVTLVSSFAAAGTSADVALGEASDSLAAAKARTLGPMATTGVRERARRSLRLEHDLHVTLHAHATGTPDERSGTLLLDYQPCFDARTGALVACEALVRWQHPNLGLLNPGQFLDIVEDRALVEPLGAWVLQQAVDDGARWHRLHTSLAPQIWVNVAVAQLGASFTAHVDAALRGSDLPAHLLCLEVTERQPLTADLSVLHDLRDLGVDLAIDDFGTGFASIEHLRTVPATHLKIDASYVRRATGNARDLALVSTMVELGHTWGMSVVAEGVETDAEQSSMVDLGADLLQGFALGRPMPSAALGTLLTASAR